MKHFKLTDTDLSLIFQSPGKLTIFVAVFITVFLCTVILIQVDAKNGMNITGVLTQRQEQIAMALSDDYEGQVSQILNNYLLLRDSQEFAGSNFCHNTVRQSVTEILDLKVPVDYKEFHLKLAVLLDREDQNCDKQNQTIKNQLGEEWSELMGEYRWLNN